MPYRRRMISRSSGERQPASARCMAWYLSLIHIFNRDCHHALFVRNKVFTLELGDIAPNEKRVVKITVEFKTDAGGKTYTNLAAATGDNGSASGRSPEIEVVSSGSSGTPVLTDIHYQLFGGYADGLWRPNDRVSLQEACTVVYLSLIHILPGIGIQLITIIKIPTSKYKCPLYLVLRYFE